MKKPNSSPTAFIVESDGEPADLDPLSSTSVPALSGRLASNGSNAARDVFVWLRQLARDRDLMPLGIRVGIEISQCVDRQKGYAHPPHSQLMRDLGASRRGIQMAVKQLEEKGHIAVTVGRGAGHANRYKLKLDRSRPG